MEAFKRFRAMEPAVWFFAIRAVLYIAAGATGAWLTPDDVEPILTAVGGLFGVDVATTAATRASVTPVAKEPKPRVK